MKKELSILFYCILASSVYTKSPTELIIPENGKKEFTVSGESYEKNAAVYTRKKLILNKGASLIVKGEIEKGEKPIVAINTTDKFGQNYLTIKEDANFNVDVKLTDTSVYYPNQPLVGIKTYGSRGGAEIEKGGSLNITVHSNKPLVKQSNINEEHKDNRDLFHQLYYSSVGFELGQDLNSSGKINIESTGWGLSYNDKKIPKEINFKDGAETKIQAGLIGLYQPEDGTTVTFENGSKTKLISGMYGLVARKVNIKNGAQIDAYGKYGLGNFEYHGDGDKYYFEKGSEVNILANRAALYSISLQEGETKLNAKAKNVFQQVDTRQVGYKELATFTVNSGSILEGNIEESWRAKIKLDEGTKLFVNDRIDTNLIAKGDIYVGPRTAYEKVENKVYEKEVKKELGDVDAVVGASVILMGDLKKQKLDDLKTDEIDDHFGIPRDIHPFQEVDPNKYYTVRFNDYTGKNYQGDERKVKINFDNAKIHLRLGKEKAGKINDKLYFSKISTIEENSKAKVKVYVEKGFNPNKAGEIKFIESDKELDTAKIFNFEDIKIGAMFYKYDIAKSKLIDTGVITEDGQKSLAETRNNLMWNKNINSEIFGKIFAKNDSETRDNFWLLSSNINLKNRDTKDKFQQNNYYAGYDFNVIPKLRLGLFSGKSNGLNKSDNYGLYIVKDFDEFYIGGAFKNSKIKIGNKKLSHNDFAVITGHKFKTDDFFVENKIALVRGEMPEYTTTKNDLDTRREKFNYLNGELTTKLGYKHSNLSLFIEANLSKNLFGKQKVVWNEGVEKELKQDEIDTTVSLGGEYKLSNHKIDLKLSKKWNKYYKSNIGVSFGYSYRF